MNLTCMHQIHTLNHTQFLLPLNHSLQQTHKMTSLTNDITDEMTSLADAYGKKPLSRLVTYSIWWNDSVTFFSADHTATGSCSPIRCCSNRRYTSFRARSLKFALPPRALLKGDQVAEAVVVVVKEERRIR